MPLSNFIECIEAALDTNVGDGVSASIDMRDTHKLGVAVVAKTGTHGTHVITVQESPNDTDWFDSSSTITGVGIVEDIEVDMRYARVKVTTPESATSTCDVYMQAK